jgi:hypothetical protein
MTLEEKSAAFLGRLQQRHNRYGFVADSQLTGPGDLTSSRPAPTDNGLWTSIYRGGRMLSLRGDAFAPGASQRAPEGWEDKALDSLEILSHLGVARDG